MDRVLIHEEVLDGLSEGRPVVVLETAVLTHGLPRRSLDHMPGCFAAGRPLHELGRLGWDSSAPVNLATSRAMSRAVRMEDAIPATIAVIDGMLHVGLCPERLEELSRVKADKCSTRDLAATLQSGRSGGTTVAGTLSACAVANRILRTRGLSELKLFATGGIGGVHRDWADHPDISADIRAISQTPMMVVTAGAKIILDLPATREALDTGMIPVIGWQCDNFPRFTSKGAPDQPLERRIDDHTHLSELCRIHWEELERAEGILLLNEIPSKDALDGAMVEQIVTRACEMARDRGINGQSLTPFLLTALAEETSGESLDANIALLLGNARLAAEAASALAGATSSG